MKLKQKHKMSVWQYLALGYVVAILLGSVLLVLPFASKEGGTSYLDALFTATSATCVTGLIVYDTSVHWSIFGQVVILMLIQVGGLGFTTFVTILFMMIKKGALGVYEKRAFMQSFGGNRISETRTLALRVIIGTFSFETLGAIVLSIRFIPQFGGIGVFYAVFHAVSAFCNAGFDLMGSAGTEFASLTAYATDPLVSITLPVLIIVGGLGFCVWGDVLDCRFHVKKFRFYTKFIILASAILIVLSTGLYLLFEWNNPCYAGYNFGEKLLCSFFNAATARYGGFATSDLTQLSDSGYLLTLLLMFVGGCSGSTAGGIKVSTFAIILMGLGAALRGRRDINLGKRRIDNSLLGQAFAIFAAYLSIIIVATMTVCAIQPQGNFREVLFETVSALGTVGLSLGYTAKLLTASKIIMILLMYLGRVGLVTFYLAIIRERKNGEIRLPLADSLYIG